MGNIGIFGPRCGREVFIASECEAEYDFELFIDNYILKLVNQIMEIQETHRVPEKTIFKSNELFKAIDGNNYQLALDINERFNRRKNINNSENIDLWFNDCVMKSFNEQFHYDEDSIDCYYHKMYYLKLKKYDYYQKHDICNFHQYHV